MTFPSQSLSQDISLLINEISMSLEIMLNEMFMKVKVCSVVLGKKLQDRTSKIRYPSIGPDLYHYSTQDLLASSGLI